MNRILCIAIASGFLMCSADLSALAETQTTQLRQFASNTDYRVQQGSGGYEDRRTGIGYTYRYEVWSNRMNTRYTLKVWSMEDYPMGSYKAYMFRSGREALDYFDCNYAKKRIPSCPSN